MQRERRGSEVLNNQAGENDKFLQLQEQLLGEEGKSQKCPAQTTLKSLCISFISISVFPGGTRECMASMW